jgi:hypothetical protein
MVKRKKLKILQREDRACGECFACCHVLAIRDLDKPVGEDCKHLDRTREVHHCTIYDQRPFDCQQYTCAWVREAGFGDVWHRPDKLGVLFTPRDNKWEVVPFAGPFTLIAHETREGAFEELAAKKFMRHVAGHFLVFGFHGPLLDKCRAMGPADKLKAVFEWCDARGYTKVTGILKGERQGDR